MGPCSLQSVTKGIYFVLIKQKNFPKKICYIKQKKNKCLTEMKKNSGENFQPLQVDPITGEYYVIIPEWMANDLSWYEDTEINLSLENGEIILSERDTD